MIRVGFSTDTSSIISAVVRWFTGSKTSHVWLLFDDTFFGLPMVLESADVGFRLIPYENFKAQHNTVLAVLDPPYPLDVGVREAAMWIGESYDYTGLVGSVFVLLGRWLKRKWRNPWASPKALFCTESVVRVMQASHYPGSETLDPTGTTPQDLLDFFVGAGLAQPKLARGKRFGRAA